MTCGNVGGIETHEWFASGLRGLPEVRSEREEGRAEESRHLARHLSEARMRRIDHCPRRQADRYAPT